MQRIRHHQICGFRVFATWALTLAGYNNLQAIADLILLHRQIALNVVSCASVVFREPRGPPGTVSACHSSVALLAMGMPTAGLCTRFPFVFKCFS
jgi:hypothetical protein